VNGGSELDPFRVNVRVFLALSYREIAVARRTILIIVSMIITPEG
jgi:hypothetical protein